MTSSRAIRLLPRAPHPKATPRSQLQRTSTRKQYSSPNPQTKAPRRAQEPLSMCRNPGAATGRCAHGRSLTTFPRSPTRCSRSCCSTSPKRVASAPASFGPQSASFPVAAHEITGVKSSQATSPHSSPGGSRPRYSCLAFGDVAEWLRSGLQSRLHRFDSGRRL